MCFSLKKKIKLKCCQLAEVEGWKCRLFIEIQITRMDQKQKTEAEADSIYHVNRASEGNQTHKSEIKNCFSGL